MPPAAFPGLRFPTDKSAGVNVADHDSKVRELSFALRGNKITKSLDLSEFRRPAADGYTVCLNARARRSLMRYSHGRGAPGWTTPILARSVFDEVSEKHRSPCCARRSLTSSCYCLSRPPWASSTSLGGIKSGRRLRARC